jgi:ATP-dependent helicase HepA
MKVNFEKHMYVRCPFDREHPDNPRDFITGQIQEIDDIADTAVVKFMDPFNFRGYYDYIPAEPISFPLQMLLRVSAYEETYVEYQKERYIVISSSLEEGWFYYCIQNEMNLISKCVREDEIIAPFTTGRISPVEQLKHYEFQNPVWYMGRSVVGKTIHILNNSVYGFKELAGCKIFLLPHQLNTIMRCLQEDKCRYMIADEVGMGKTIEAASILKIYLLHNAGKRILIVVPTPLIEQWKTELFIKFDIEAGIDKRDNNVQLISANNIGKYIGRSWDFVIVDEVHKLLGNEGLYRVCHALSCKAENILLLSATPVQQKEKQYLDLLRLILPAKYDSMSLEAFTGQVVRQRKITRAMYNILADFEDLNDSIEKALLADEDILGDDDCVSIYEDIVDEMNDVGRLLEDDFLNELLSNVDEEISLKGKATLQEGIIYVCNNYQIEGSILRNRRSLIRDKMAKREVKPIDYQLDPERNTYEAATYEAIVDWITGQKLEEKEFEDFYIPILEAYFSSSWAFIKKLKALEKRGMHISEEVADYAREWIREEDELLQDMEHVLAEPFHYSNRIVSTVDYIDQETVGKKVVLFTNYTETFEKYAKVLKSYFGENSVALFHKQMGSDELELNIYRFQNDVDCRILLCDDTGGEGRNLQSADVVLHIDLPWDANAIEQRIGRLDRLGRDSEKTVLSVVVHTRDTLESELYRFWRDGLKVFEQSLSGLEIIMNEINEHIIRAVTNDFRYGISDAIEEVVASSQKMEKEVREEQLFDTADFIYGNLNQQLKVTLDKYHRNENHLFAGSMMGWASLAGFKGESTKQGNIRFSEKSFSIGSAIKSMFIPPKWDEYISKTSTSFARRVQTLYDNRKGMSRQMGGLRILEGTFDREVAIKNDYLHFFAPGDEIFDSIVNNALHSDKGQCAAFLFKTDIEWKGFVFTFSLEPNTQILLENSIPDTSIGRFKSYMGVDQIVIPVAFSAYSDIPAEKVIAQLDKLSEIPVSKQRDVLIHFGRRSVSTDFMHIKERFGVSNLEWFTSQYPSDIWEENVKTAHKRAVEKAKMRFSKSSSLKSAEREVNRMMNTEVARSRYFGTKPEELSAIRERYMLIIQALRKSRIVTESAAFVWMVNTNDKKY